MDSSRRRFLTYMGMGTYAMMTSKAFADPAPFPLPRRKAPAPTFKPIAPSKEDRLILPDGFNADVLCVWDDPLGSTGPHGPEKFGFNCDFIAYFPIDALQNGRSNSEGLLWVNHENPNPLFVSKFNGTPPKNETQVLAEKLCVGGSVIHVKHDGKRWTLVKDSKYAKRLTALYPKIALSGPASAVLPEVTGTLANCSGGKTPWNTALSCEENFEEYNGEKGISLPVGYRWSDAPGQKIDETHYGWVVEVDPFGELPPLKLSALGRFVHENTAWRLGKSNKMAVYMGDDAADQYLYKFVSAGAHDEKRSRADQRKILSEGTLYVADFQACKWLPLDIKRSPALAAAGFKDQADVLIRAREASAALKATPLDRPEDCEIHPLDGSLYVALTNNSKHGNFLGQIIRLVENNDDAESEFFRFEIFLAGGPQTGMACPDNLMFDKAGNLWVACDMSTRSMHKGAYEPFGNNGLFMVPTSGSAAGDAFQFASGPVGSELTGPWFSENEDTLFLSVQHPGEHSPNLESFTSHWPGGGDTMPKPGVVAITGFKR